VTPLQRVFPEQGQSAWLDNIRRDWILDGRLQAWVDRGVRGLTSNPSIFEKAIKGSGDYDQQFFACVDQGQSVEEAYWELVIRDITDALAILLPVYRSSNGLDGFASVEVDPGLARRTDATLNAARQLAERFDAPNLYIKIPATKEGLGPIEDMIAEKRSVNVTLIFSLERYAEVIEAYLRGLERTDGDLSGISSVASFFISRVDNEVDRRLDELGTPEALALRGNAAVANARLAYALFAETFSGPRWEALQARGARVQRPLWASTSTKNPSYPDTLYVDELIGPNTVNTLPDATLEAFEDHGTVSRTIDQNVDGARSVLEDLAALGIHMADVTAQLEAEGVAAFEQSFGGLLEALTEKLAAHQQSS